MQRRWLALPLIVIVVAAGTYGVRRILPDAGTDTTASRPPENVRSGSVLSEQQVRDVLQHPSAPLKFQEFDADQEETGPAPPPFCYERSSADGGAVDILLQKLTGPRYGPEYQGAGFGVQLVLMRVPSQNV